MPEQIQNILNRVLEWWGKFTSKQKTFIVAIAAGIVLTMAIMLTFLNQTQYVHLVVATSPAEAAEIRDLFVADGKIKYKQSADSLRFEVDKKQHAEAIMLMASNNIQTQDWSIDNVTSGGFSTTEADKQKKYKYYLENQISRMAETIESVKSARTMLDIPYNDGTLLSQQKEASAALWLTLNGEFSEEQAAVLAKSISVALGSSTPLNITIMDSNSRMLFSGDDMHSTTGGSASNQLTVKSKLEQEINNEVRKVLQNTDAFSKLMVSSNFDIDFSSITSTDNQYYIDEGREEGFIAHEDHYEAENTNQGGGIPGTDSNTEGTSYQWADHASSSSSESESSIDRLVSQMITTKDTPAGRPLYDTASIAVTGTKFNIIREEDIKRQGLLDGITWDEYKDANRERTILQVDEAFYNIVAHASGISPDRITILAFEENTFMDAEGMQISWNDVSQIFLIVIILGLLAFMVIRSMRSAKEEDEEEELSVERLLQSQPVLEDISIDEGSESKKIIDKFVEDNPEAAASLLRNWLNEDWG